MMMMMTIAWTLCLDRFASGHEVIDKGHGATPADLTACPLCHCHLRSDWAGAA